VTLNIEAVDVLIDYAGAFIMTAGCWDGRPSAESSPACVCGKAAVQLMIQQEQKGPAFLDIIDD
jgi:hypothetical protein